MVLFASSLILLWLFVSYLKLQRALRWWFQQQVRQLLGEVAQIQDGLLQESFSLRRSLELALVEEAALTSQARTWLEGVEKLHRSLEQLSDSLLPVCLGDGLPLAVQQLVKAWERRNPGLEFEVTLPDVWRSEPAERSVVILRSLEELLKMALAEPLSQAGVRISLSLQPSAMRKQTGQLAVQITYPNLSALTARFDAQTWQSLQKVLRILISGQCSYRKQNSTLVCELRW